MNGAEVKTETHADRFFVKKHRGGFWWSVMARTPVDETGKPSVPAEVSAFSHKDDADRYCAFLNSAVVNFFNT